VFDDIIMITYCVVMVEVLLFGLGQRTVVCVGYQSTCSLFFL